MIKKSFDLGLDWLDGADPDYRKHGITLTLIEHLRKIAIKLSKQKQL